EILDRIDRDERILRPANLPRLPGRGSGIFEARHRDVGVLVLSGRFGMDYSPDNPFIAVDKEIAELKKSCSTVLVDFHAESTSEKIAMRYALEGKVSLLVGTHTHVQTADEQIRGGTGYITDLGMCGPEDSVIGVDPAWALEQFRSGKAFTAKTWPEGDAVISGVFCEIGNDGKCVRIERILKNVKL
ncbi:MAG: YmdB family metallophosphoesterase, partial [Clostridia bacterium]|nr:YmdB family metallophosphoesterase [Clostridia bacterium]